MGSDRGKASGDTTPSSGLDWVLGQMLGLVRWVTVLALFVLSLAQPLLGRLGQPTWLLVLGFAGYSMVISVIRSRVVWLRSPARTAVLDVVIVSALYTIAASPGGPVFVLLLLVTVSASCTTPWPRSLACMLGTLVVVLLVSPTLPLWAASAVAARDLFARVSVLTLANLGATLLIRQLRQEHATAREARVVAQHQAEVIQLRQAFVASVSHELRTPLTSVRAGLGMLEMSLSHRMRADEAHLLGTTRRNSDRLGLLVGDLLTYNQLDAQALRLEHELLDMHDVIQHAVGAVAPLLADKGQSLTIQVAEWLPLRSDARRLEQVVLNLVATAHEHTPPGTRIVITARRTADDVLVTVSDDGPGIPVAAREWIFDPFHQVHPMDSGGAGLGLALAKRIVELHGGRLWVERASLTRRGADDQPAQRMEHSEDPQAAKATQESEEAQETEETQAEEQGAGTTFCVALPCLVSGEGHVDGEGGRVRHAAAATHRR